MISNTMPVPSGQEWTLMLEHSPRLIADYNNKSFFDYAEDSTVTGHNLGVDGKICADDIVDNIIVEDFVSMEDMENTYTTLDSKVILTLSGGEGEETMEVASALIPTTALEIENSDFPLSHPGLNASFLAVNLPLSLGTQPISPPLRVTATSAPTPTPSYPQTPSTPSCQSTCSDDMSSAVSDVSTPSAISGVTSGKQFLFPMPSDDKMAAAALNALETRTLTPLIKEELKYTIQSRRMAAGKPELVVDASPPVKRKKVMTEEERERAVKRREQNRVAAQRFRQKQKDTADVLSRKCQRVESANCTLRAEIKRLAREKQELRQLLASHLLVCPKVKVAR